MSEFSAGRFEATDEWTSVDFPGFEPSGQPVVVASITSFNGANTAGIRMRKAGPDGMDVFIEEEKSGDKETSHVKEAGRFFAASKGPIRDASGSRIGEAGIVELGQPDGDHWHKITLDGSYDDPVVFTQIMSYRGGDPCHGRIRNVGSDEFEFQIEEWNYLDGSHTNEQIGYIVVEKGVHELEDGTPLEVRESPADDSWARIGLQGDFGSEPALVSRPQTQKGGHEIVTRNRNLGSGGVEVRVQEEEQRGGAHVKEDVSVLATPRRDVGLTFGRAAGVTHDWSQVEFGTNVGDDPVVLAAIESFNGANTAGTRLRNLTPTSAEVRVEEETSADDETDHIEETISLVAAASGPILDANGDRIGQAGRLDTDQPDRDTWHNLSFEESYADPVVFMQIETYNGGQPCHIRVQNAGSDGCEFQIEEWNYLNGKHTGETIGYIVFEKGVHELADGAVIQVGETQSDDGWNKVGFASDFKNKQPALVTQCQTRKGSNEVVTRTVNAGQEFRVRLQEEEGRDGKHTVEQIGFLAIARPSDTVPEFSVSAGLPDMTSKVDGFRPDTCGFFFDNSAFVSGQYTLPNPIRLPAPLPNIEEIGDVSNGMCGGMVLAARDYFEHGISPWSDQLVSESPPNSPTNDSVPDEDTPLFDYLSERLFDSFKPGSGNAIGATKYWTLMNSPNTPVTGAFSFTQPKKSRNEVMRDEWEGKIKPALDNNVLCPIGLVHEDTHGNLLDTGLKAEKLGNNHQVLAYGYKQSGNDIEIYVYDPNCPGRNDVRIQFTKKNDIGNWYEPKFTGPTGPLYAFFEVPYSRKNPPRF